MFYQEISFFLKTFFFVYIGLLLNIENLKAVLIGSVIAVSILLLRSLSLLITHNYKPFDRMLINSLFARGIAPVGQSPLDLTPTEFDLLKIMLNHPGRAFTRLELIEQGLGYAYAGMERTIDAHIKNLRKKIGVGDEDPAFIETVYGVGYRLRGDG